jgi:hypothetical protein
MTKPRWKPQGIISRGQGWFAAKEAAIRHNAMFPYFCGQRISWSDYNAVLAAPESLFPIAVFADPVASDSRNMNKG